ncbi:expansin-A13-like [Durio zibethinus]|uniref:Expansin n=1 Tax=Durio zibethinus TaxID=66656 RepID=A0A6P5ZIC1_DURZI|nr:expansin-A13-like [Durio zibethinus]
MGSKSTFGMKATNFCAPNYGFTADGGGRCNPSNEHFVLPIEAFEKIAIWKAGNMPVQYRRVKCREGGVQFTIDGSVIFVSLLISNVGGAGDIVAVKIKAVIGLDNNTLNSTTKRKGKYLSHKEVTTELRVLLALTQNRIHITDLELVCQLKAYA